MIGRRLTAHLKQQHWTGVFMELVIVVLGVFIGLQANNWNNNRLDQARSREYMARIRVNLLDDANQLKERIAFWSAVSRQGHVALAFAENGRTAPGPAWNTLRAFVQASEAWRFSFNATTYDELRSAGQLGLIRDPALRAALANYYVTNPVRRGTGLYLMLPKYRETLRSAVPSSLMDYYWKACHHDDQLTQALIACDSPMPDDQATTLIKELVNTPHLVPQLRYWIDSLDVSIKLAGYDRQAAQTLAARIGRSSE